MINALQIILAGILIGAILMQAKGSGLGSAFGGGGNIYQTKRGAEKVLYNSTIVLGIIFFSIAFANALILNT